METPADQLSELMRRYAAGEDAVFEELYRMMAPRLHRFCCRLVARGAEADDLFQDTLLRLHRARATFMPGASVMHWAFAITRSVHLDRLRYRRRRPEDLGSASDAAQQDRLHADERYSPEAAVRARALRDIVTAELGKLSEKNRVAYVLLKEEGLSVKDAAAVLGTTPAVVKQRAHRAYEHLRVALGNAGWKEDEHDGSWDAIAVRV